MNMPKDKHQMQSQKLKLPSYGGQALMEGVLMRGAHAVSAAMRAPNGEIVLQSETLTGIYKTQLARIPFLRGLVILWDALGLGSRFLIISANLQTGEDEKIEGLQLSLTMIFSFLIAALFFFALPAGIGHLTDSLLFKTPQNINLGIIGNLIEGLVRLLLVIGYIWGVGKVPDIARFFAYHGAEHKTINAFEAGAELTPESVAQFPLYHPRCGTGFVLIVVLFSVLLFTFLGPLPLFWRLFTRILFIPILAMLAYEYMRWTANHLHNPIVQILIWPNLAMQRLTTREPTRAMLEVSIAAFQSMLEQETNSSATTTS
jgi:uncharacterized protein YqhQ